MALSQIDFSFDDNSAPNEKLKEAVKQHPPAGKNTLADIRAGIKPKTKRGRRSLKPANTELEIIDVPEDEVLFQKQYYSIGKVAAMFKENNSLIRYWEKEFTILKPKKNKKGDRYFRPVDIKNLHLIYHLLRQRKYTIEGAKDFLKKNNKAEEKFETIKKLGQIRGFLLEMKAMLR